MGSSSCGVKVLYNIYNIFTNQCHSEFCMCMYAFVLLRAHVLYVKIFQQKILCILEKIDNRIMSSVVHYEAHFKCAYLNPISILYAMLFTGVAHPMGLNSCHINVAFKTFSKFVSFYHCHITNCMMMEQVWSSQTLLFQLPTQQLYNKFQSCPLICSSSRASSILSMPITISTVWPLIPVLDLSINVLLCTVWVLHIVCVAMQGYLAWEYRVCV